MENPKSLSITLYIQVNTDEIPEYADIVVLANSPENAWEILGTAKCDDQGKAEIFVESGVSNSSLYTMAVLPWGQPFVSDMTVEIGDVIRPTQFQGWMYRVTAPGELPSTEPDWWNSMAGIPQPVGTAMMQAVRHYQPIAHGPVDIMAGEFKAPVVTMVSSSNTKIKIIFDAPVYADVELYIQQDGNFVLADSVSASIGEFIYTDVTPNGIYTFRLRAVFKTFSIFGEPFEAAAFEYFYALGGDISTFVDGIKSYRVHTFTASGELIVTDGGDVDVLLVGGGGSGGANNTGGGGGAGRLLMTSTTVAPGVYQVVVGEGGASVSGNIPGNDGGDSSIFSLVAPGGGGGGQGGGGGGATTTHVGRDGGSGGGGGGTWNGSGNPPGGQAVEGSGGAVIDVGHAGSAGIHTPYTDARAAGGGGGAGSVGGTPTNNYGGFGGDGLELAFDGTLKWYAAGGQGGKNGSGTRQSTNGIGGMGASGQGPATSGVDGTGSGGGGSREKTWQASGAGGSGVVIIKYRTGVA